MASIIMANLLDSSIGIHKIMGTKQLMTPATIKPIVGISSRCRAALITSTEVSSAPAVWLLWFYNGPKPAASFLRVRSFRLSRNSQNKPPMMITTITMRNNRISCGPVSLPVRLYRCLSTRIGSKRKNNSGFIRIMNRKNPVTNLN